MNLKEQIPFELHITVSDIETNKLGFFASLCEEMEGKPLLIELSRGDFCKQPMFNTVVYGNDLQEAVAASKTHIKNLTDTGFSVNRLKIEIPAYCYSSVTDKHNFKNTDYFEWHGKIDFEREPLLLEVCEKYSAHLSKNALKDTQDKRFITLREFGEQTVFEERIATLIADLHQNGFGVHKQQAEYCIYDTNVGLDKNWLFNN